MEITKQEAIERLNKIEEEQKELRRVIEGYSPVKSIWDVKNFNDVLAIAKEKGYKFNPKEDDEEDEFYYKRTKLICQVLNEGWHPKHIDKRWYPYFSLSSGFDFDSSYDEGSFSVTSSGFRLCLKSEKLADFAGKTFTKEFEKFYM